MKGLQIRGETIARNAAINLGGQLLPLLTAVVAVPLVIRGLGSERFGILSIAWLIVSFLGELGFGSATTKFVAESLAEGQRERLRHIIWASSSAQLMLGLGVGLVLAVATPFLVHAVLGVPPGLAAEARTSLYLVAAAIPCVLVGAAFRGVLEADQRFDLINMIRVPASIANYGLPLVALVLGWKLPGVIGLLLASRVVVAVLYFVAGARLHPELRSAPVVQRTELRRVVGFGGWSSVSGVMSPMLVYADRFMLGALAGATAVGYYTPPFELANRLLVVPVSMATTLFPAFSALERQDRARMQRMVWRTVKFMLCVVGPAVLLVMLSAPDLLSVWLGRDYAVAGTLPLRLLSAGILVNSLAYVPYALLLGQGRPDLPAKFHLIELPLHLLATWWLVSTYGIAGAAMAWLLRVLVDTTLLFLATGWTHGISLASFRAERLPRTLVVLGAMAAICIFLTFWPATPALRFVLVMLTGGAMVPVFWLLALGADDRRGVLELLQGVLAPARGLTPPTRVS